MEYTRTTEKDENPPRSMKCITFFLHFPSLHMANLLFQLQPQYSESIPLFASSQIESRYSRWTSHFFGSSLFILFWQSPLFETILFNEGWLAISLLSSSEYYLTTDEMESKLVPPSLWWKKIQQRLVQFWRWNTATTLDFCFQWNPPSQGGKHTEYLRPAKIISAHLWKSQVCDGQEWTDNQ